MDIFILLGLGLITAAALWLARRKRPRDVVEGFRVWGEQVPGERVVLVEIRKLATFSLLRSMRLRPEELERIEVEWVDVASSPASPNGKLLDGRASAGTVVPRRNFPWESKTKYLVARIVKNDPKTGRLWGHAVDSALAHEIILHAVAYRTGDASGNRAFGLFRGHRNESLSKLLEEVEEGVTRIRG